MASVQIFSTRFTNESEPAQRWLTYIRKFADIIVQELSEQGKNHYHALLRMNKSTYVSWMKKWYPGGNKLYATKPIVDSADLHKTLCYFCKGASSDDLPNVLFMHGLIDYVGLHEKWWSVAQEVQTKSRKRKSSHSILEECYTSVPHSSMSAKDIGVHIMRFYVSKKIRLPSQFAMTSMITTYLAWNNESADDQTRISDDDLFCRLYPKLDLV